MKIGAIETLVIVIVVLGLVLGLFFFLLKGDEDNWIKDSKGIYVKHGAPSETPDYVLEQQDAIVCANDLYFQVRANGVVLNSQCLGACGKYSIDVVNIPRNSDDDKTENQCGDYPRVTPYFIELDKNGEVVRVA